MKNNIFPKQTKTERSISALSAKEMRYLLSFAACSMFNNRPEIVRLLEWLSKHPLEPREKTFARVFPGQPYSDQRLRLTLSHTQRLIERFLATQQWIQTSGTVELGWAQAARLRGLDDFFPDAAQHTRQVLSQKSQRNTDHFIQWGQLLWEEARFESARRPADFSYLDQLSENADLIWLSAKLRYLCLYQAQQIVYQSEHLFRFRQELAAMAIQFDYLGYPTVAIWYYCWKMLETPLETTWFEQFKTLLFTRDTLFDKEEIRDLHLFAINYCIRQANSGQRHFLHTMIDIYKDSLSKGHLLDHGEMSRYTYHNIVTAGLQTREFDWVEWFIHQYKSTLSRTYRDSSFSFNLARLEFSRKRYEVVLPLLQNSNYYDPLLGLAAKTMSMKIYYETGEFDLLQAHLEAMKNYIRRKPTLGYHRAHYLHLIRFTQKLSALNRHDAGALAALKTAIEAEPALMEKAWLLEQLG